MTYRELIEEQKKKYPGAAARENEPMSAHTSLKIGGEAAAYFEPVSAEELKSIVSACAEEGLRYFVLGKGSNVLFADGRLDLAVISTSGLSEIKTEGETITAGAGAALSKIASAALAASLTGFETLHGIPGSLGGAVYMNAGAYGGEIKDVCESVTVLENGEIREYAARDCDFSYRHSAFEDKDAVIISARFRLKPGDPEKIRAIMRDLSDRRRAKQPLEFPSAGSTFKRPAGDFAARLIEAAGLKGRQNGGAQVSEKHAGFLINRGGATFEDFYGLMEIVKKEVFKFSGVLLEPEVRIIR
ncbi:MAG: UDP-N-acetylmuramate dehydrogenase [Oscillospiraceae bacterium]|nr:UDP-N-acetylmuramate dehydrogenase [Oscillospiraceae bacterium]MBQ5514375.1 UDP-N-acetylmuramate dehydrogenase [Oscillospiraceae bacterium]